MTVAIGMRYGNPSIAEGLEQLRQANAQRILILPLYPQYSSATTGSTFDAIAEVLKGWRWVPDIRFISHYPNLPAYIHALATQIKNDWAEHGMPDKLLFSYHGIPKRFFLAGDPYHCECHKTARLVAQAIDLPKEKWQVVFQSRFGREEWLKPYTDQTLEELGKAGTKRVDVICPGFAADCLETLEEIDQQNRQLFLQAGGQEFHYISALNENAEHIQAMLELVKQHSQGWTECQQTLEELEQEAQQRARLYAGSTAN
jgi:ferrochelatase